LWCSEYESILETLGGIKELDAKFEDKVIVNTVSQFTGRGVGKSKTVSDDITACRKLVIGAKEFRYVSWNDKLELVKKYIDENKKRPGTSSKDPQTKSLGSWISTQITNYKKIENIMADPTIYSTWEIFINNPVYSEYFLDNYTIWNNNFNELKNYLATNKKRPTSASKYPRTKALGRWLENQLKHYRKKVYIMVDPSIYSKWELFINNSEYSEYFIDKKTIWNNKLCDLKIYMNTYNKRPSVASKDKQIKSLAKWLSHQIANYSNKKDIMSDPTIYSIWELFITDTNYSKYFIDNKEYWNNTFAELKIYLDKNKKRPSAENKDKRIKFLGIWLINQTINYKKKTQIMSDITIYSIWEKFIINPAYSEYFIDNYTSWNTKFSELKTYLDTYKMKPSSYSKDTKIINLRRWLTTQITNYSKKKDIMSDPAVNSVWKLFIENPAYSEYFIDNITAWNNKLAELKNYLAINKERPRITNENPKTKNLSKWLQRQITNYSKKTQIMKETTIYAQFTDFINHPNYKQYFNLIPDKNTPTNN
jgi:hypothetical protein